ncbi:MAG: hypothetical protein ACYTBJ_24795 [Planctomycetota bacterium]|jgi:hypothetical protein
MREKNCEECDLKLLTACMDCGVNGQWLYYDSMGLSNEVEEEDVSDE